MTAPPVPLPPPASVDATLELLASQDYVADRRLATAVFLAQKLGRPLFLEGEAGVGKTEVAKVLRRWTGGCLLYTSPSPRDRTRSRMPSSA